MASIPLSNGGRMVITQDDLHGIYDMALPMMERAASKIAATANASVVEHGFSKHPTVNPAFSSQTGHSTGGVARAEVWTSSYVGRYDNNQHNTLLRALGSGGI